MAAAIELLACPRLRARLSARQCGINRQEAAARQEARRYLGWLEHCLGCAGLERQERETMSAKPVCRDCGAEAIIRKDGYSLGVCRACQTKRIKNRWAEEKRREAGGGQDFIDGRPGTEDGGETGLRSVSTPAAAPEPESLEPSSEPEQEALEERLHLLVLDFSRHAELYDRIKAVADEEFRTPGNQVLYWLSRHLSGARK